jgi:uncharacterized protein (DUF169 family)
MFSWKKKYSINDYRNIAKSLMDRLELETDLVAVKFIKKEDDIPDNFIRPVKDLNKKITICMAMAEARKNEKLMPVIADDTPCTPGAVAHGWTKGVSPFALLKSQEDNEWVKDKMSMHRGMLKRYKLGGLFAHYPFNKFLGHKGVMVAPLSKTPFIPETCLIYGYPEQIMHVSHSLSFEGIYTPRAILAGHAESCYAGALIPKRSGKPNFVLLGMGDRALQCVEKYEVAMGMPSSLVFYTDKYLFASGGDHNLKHYLDHPPDRDHIDESLLPGWTNVRKLMDRKRNNVG